ncbi:hypothetical protein [Paraliomyxa miuraensis]|uniref:hypothetical protein n=1 Tax=Paraliomyxa miuraensis TaxID=376150 RepID=UPI00224EAD1F|nr:hypothetical protein [Paraliomyxa miuraensis]MCX4243805.1 hypothetical protein [Paraliomyxa miuraensis]
MSAPLRARQLTGLVSVVTLTLTLACDGKKEPSMAEALEQSDKKAEDEKKAKEAEAAKAAEAAKKAKEGVVEHPWTFDGVKTSLVIGTVLAWEMSGTNAKGKPVQDTLHGEIAGHDDLDVKILEYKESQKNVPAVMQPQGHPWGKLSPFFWVEQNETTILRKEAVQVPAGSFECVVAEITGYFGNHLTVWMIVDKPGIYAKVIEHPNTKSGEGEGEDQTEITYALASIENKG